MKIQYSDLMLINRALAHDAAPTDQRQFVDDEGRFIRYQKRKPSIMTAKETTKDIEASANKMLRSLHENEARRIREKHKGEDSIRDRHLKIILDVVSKYASFEELKAYAPVLLKML